MSKSFRKIAKKSFRLAQMKYEKIYPCGGDCHFSTRCFTINGEDVLFWFNTEDQSTHVVIVNI